MESIMYPNMTCPPQKKSPQIFRPAPILWSVHVVTWVGRTNGLEQPSPAGQRNFHLKALEEMSLQQVVVCLFLQQKSASHNIKPALVSFECQDHFWIVYWFQKSDASIFGWDWDVTLISNPLNTSMKNMWTLGDSTKNWIVTLHQNTNI